MLVGEAFTTRSVFDKTLLSTAFSCKKNKHLFHLVAQKDGVSDCNNEKNKSLKSRTKSQDFSVFSDE